VGIVIDTVRAGQEQALNELYRGTAWAFHHHHPRYAQLVPLGAGVRRTLVGYRDDVPRAYASVVERGRLFALLKFGPVFAEPEDAADFIVALVEHYRRRGFARLEVQLYEPAGWRGEWITYRVARERRFTSEITAESRATAVIPLSGHPDDWSDKRLSTNHRRNVKKARHLGLRTELMMAADVPQFSEQYVRMYRSRGLAVDATHARAMIAGRFTFLRETGEGQALKVCTSDGTMLGGLFIMQEGNRAFYDTGATDPEHRHVPILHLGILDSIAWASLAGCTLFDLGGYGFLADAADQIAKINRFKDGFRPQPLFFTRPMHFTLSPVGGRFFDIARNARRRLSQSSRSVGLRSSLTNRTAQPRGPSRGR
jgi:GNAT acetyltransferase-like protein